MSPFEITAETIQDALTDADAETMWQVYVDAFAGASEKCAQRQVCYEHQSFIEATKDTDYVKVVVRHTGIIVGFVLMTNNIEKASITNCSPEFYRSKYSEYVARNELYYVTALAVKPELQGKTSCFMKICEQFTIFMDENDRLLAGDYTDNSTPWLTKGFKKVGQAYQKALDLQHDDVEIGISDVQYYFTLRVTKS